MRVGRYAPNAGHRDNVMAALRNLIGGYISVTGTVAIPNNSNTNTPADYLTVDNTTNKAMLGDFGFFATFGGATSGGALALAALDWDLQGLTTPLPPSNGLTPRYVGTFDRKPISLGVNPYWFRLNNVPLTYKTSFIVYNVGTGQAINVGWLLRMQPWSPG